MTTKTKRYNGWKNYETWNVALWLSNDEGLYRLAKAYVADGYGYEELAQAIREDYCSTETADGVSWTDSGLDVPALNRCIREF